MSARVAEDPEKTVPLWELQVLIQLVRARRKALRTGRVQLISPENHSPYHTFLIDVVLNNVL